MWVPSENLLRWTQLLSDISLIIIVVLVAYRTPARIDKVVKTLEDIRDKS